MEQINNNEEVSRAGEHSDTDDEEDGGVVLLHHQLLQSLQSTTTTPLSEQTSLITQLRSDPQLMRSVISHRRHQRQGRIRDESTQTDDDPLWRPAPGPSESNSVCRSVLETQELIDAAFSNVVILDKILHFLKSRKSLRLVCKHWNNVLLSGKAQMSLSLNSMCRIPDLDWHGESRLEFKIQSLDPKILKSIVIIDESQTEMSTTEETGELLLKLFQICETLGSNIQEISITWSDTAIIPILYRILGVDYGNQDPCQHIRKLSVGFTGLVKPFDIEGVISAQITQPKIIPPKSKLKTLSILCSLQNPIIYSDISTFFQDVVSSASKLEQLDVMSCSCPNLKNNKELKRLMFHSLNPNILHHHENYPAAELGIKNFNLIDISSVLAEVKDSLEFLEILSSHTHPPCDLCFHPSMQLHIPAMPKLQALINRNCEVYKIHFNMEQLRKERMPALKNLSFSNFPFNRRHDIWYEIKRGLLQQDCTMESVSPAIIGVKTLALRGIDCTEALSELRITFPDLERLNLRFQDDRSSDSYNTRVGIALRSCSTLKLRHLLIETNVGYNISHMVESMYECREALFSHLKTLKIKNQSCTNDTLTAKGEKEFEDALIMTMDMQSVVFENFLLRGGHAKRLLQFISENKLPVEFVDN